MRYFRCSGGLIVLIACSLVFAAGHAATLDLPHPPVPGEIPEEPELPNSFDGLTSGSFELSSEKISCLQKGNMDIKRPSLPITTCWESRASRVESAEVLSKVCVTQMTPMKIDSVVVSRCPPKVLGVCVGAKNGSSSNHQTQSNLYHYTPQSLQEWGKTRENCERTGGDWYGLGSSRSLF